MKPANLEAINRSFAVQAPNFESKTGNFTKEEYLNYTLSCVAPDKQDTVLEVAAGTCACGRSFAPLVQTVGCLAPHVADWKAESRQRSVKQHDFCKRLWGRTSIFERQL